MRKLELLRLNSLSLFLVFPRVVLFKPFVFIRMYFNHAYVFLQFVGIRLWNSASMFVNPSNLC